MIKRIFFGAGCLFLLLIAFWDLSEAGILILDVRMPAMSGIEVQEKVVNSGSKMPAC
jgi:FixJ family two-component response regulator